MTKVKLAAVLVIVIVLQISVFSSFTIEGVHAELLLLFAVCGGIAGGPERGAALGFVAGLSKDIFLQTPFGLSALAFCLIGCLVGFIQTGIIRQSWWAAPVTGVIGSAIGLTLFAVIGSVVGQGHLMSARLLLIVLIASSVNAFLCSPLTQAMAWAMRSEGSERSPLI